MGTRTLTIPIVPQKDATGDFSDSTLKLFEEMGCQNKWCFDIAFAHNVISNKHTCQNALGHGYGRLAEISCPLEFYNRIFH